MAAGGALRPTILVVDDVPENLKILGELLQPTYTVKVANSGEKALSVARSLPRPDLILLDIMMPGMDGYECMRRLRAQPETHDIPVIFVTARDTTDDERTGLDLGAVDYITKPIRPAIVEARVRNHLDMKATRDWLKEQNVFLEGQLARLLEILAHHLQEPVRQQFTFAQLLDRSLARPISDTAELSLSQIMAGAARLRAMLHDVVLYLAVCQGGGEAGPCAPDAVLAGLGEGYAIRFAEAGASLSIASLPKVSLGQDQLRAIFKALLDNALEYRLPDRALKVRIEAEIQGAMAVFSVRDNGMGIAPEFRERAFWIFERLKADPDHPGTGIGLAMVRKIVETARGKAWAEDGEDGGLVVRFSLPLAP